MKVVVLDLDETLGAFHAFAGFLRTMSPYVMTYELFSQMLDQHPEYLRPGILELLRHLNDNRRFNLCRVVLYTNNANVPWVGMVLRYLQEKVDVDLFSAVVHGAHPKRVQGRVKSIEDLNRCIKVPPKTEFFVVDDAWHEGFKQGAEVYVQIEPYTAPGACSLDKTVRLFSVLSKFLQNLPLN